MKEVINIQIGKCGNNVGTQFLEMICEEHGLDFSGTYSGKYRSYQLSRIGSYFREVRGNRYVPRSIMVDLDMDSMEEVKSSPYGSIFRQDNLIYGQEGTGSNWAKGHLTDGPRLKETILNVTRREAENTDCLHAFQVIHSIGGGTGSGLGDLIMDSIKDEYPGRNLSSFTILPSVNEPKSGMEIYNSVLSLNHLISHSEGTYLADNSALDNIMSEFKSYTIRDVNNVMASAISGITTCVRFHGVPNTDFRKITVNFVPYPRMHFFVPTVAPVVIQDGQRQRIVAISEINDLLLSDNKMFVDCDIKKGKYLTMAAFFRGSICPTEVVKKFQIIQNKNSGKFVEWVPDNAKTFTYEVPGSMLDLSATMIASTTALHQYLNNILGQFNSLYKRKAYVASYKSEGVNEMEFEEAVRGIKDILDEYKYCQTKTVTPSYEDMAYDNPSNTGI